MPGRSSLLATAVTSSTVSPAEIRTLPWACLAMRPVSRVRVGTLHAIGRHDRDDGGGRSVSSVGRHPDTSRRRAIRRGRRCVHRAVDAHEAKTGTTSEHRAAGAHRLRRIPGPSAFGPPGSACRSAPCKGRRPTHRPGSREGPRDAPTYRRPPRDHYARIPRGAAGGRLGRSLRRRMLDAGSRSERIGAPPTGFGGATCGA
jgi:hypothetical protein